MNKTKKYNDTEKTIIPTNIANTINLPPIMLSIKVTAEVRNLQ